MDAKHVATRLRTLAENDRRHRPALNDADLLELGARAIEAAIAAHARQFARAERLARELSAMLTKVAEVQAENVQLRSDNRALAAVAGRPEAVPTEQVVTVDSRGNLQRIVTKPLRDEARPTIGFA
jgi:hypothetical protein